VPATAGTFPITTPLFTVLLTGVILIVGALTFLPHVARPHPGTPANACRPQLLTRFQTENQYVYPSKAPLAVRGTNRASRRRRCAH
jgi:hypothetical protein